MKSPFFIALLAFFLCACDDKLSPSRMEKMVEMNQRLEKVLAPQEVADLLKSSSSDFYKVESPFSSRKMVVQDKDSIKALLQLHWQLAGEVRKKRVLLGVFLKSHERSLYFGIGQATAYTGWRVRSVTGGTVVLENSRQHVYQKIFYSL